MENKYLVPLAIATIAIITGGVLLTQQLGMKPNLQTTVVNEEGEEVESKDITDTETGEKYTVIDEAGGYEYEITNGKLILTNPDTPVYVENREKPGEQILSCGQKVRLSNGTELSVYYEGKDEDWTLIEGYNGSRNVGGVRYADCHGFSGKGTKVVNSSSTFVKVQGKYKLKERIGGLRNICAPESNCEGCVLWEGYRVKACLKPKTDFTGGPDSYCFDYTCKDFGVENPTVEGQRFEIGICAGGYGNCPGGGGKHFLGVNSVSRRNFYERTCQEPQLPTEDPCQDTPSFSLSTFTDTQGEGGTTYKAGDMVLATAEGGTGNCNIKTTANGWDSEIPFSLAKNQEDCLFGGIIPDSCTCDKCPSFTVEVDDGCNTETETFQCGCENTTPIEITVDGINIDAIPDYSRGSKFEMEASGGGGGPYEWKVTTEGWTIDNKIDYEGSGSRMPIEIPTECTEETCPGIKIEIKDECENKNASMTITCAEGDTRTRYDQYSGCHNLCEAQQQVCRQKKWEVADQNQPGYPIMYLDEECAKCSKEGLTRVCFKELSWFGLEKEKDCCETAKDHIRWTCTNGTWQTTALNPNDYQVCAIEDSIRPSKEQEQLIKNAPDCFNSQQDMFDYFAKNGVLKQDNQMRYFCNQDYCMQNVRYFINKPKKGVEVKEYNYRGSIKIKSVLNNNDFDNAFFDVTIGMKKNSPVYKQYKKQNSHKNHQIEQHYVDKSLPHTKEYLEEVSKFKGNDIQILAQIYNYLGDNYTYDFCLADDKKNADRSSGFEDALKNRNMLCVDFSIAVKLACEIHGINATLESTNDHIWNRHVFPSCDGGFFVFNGDATWYKTFTPLPERIPQTHL